MESRMDSVLGERVLSIGLSVVTAQIYLAGKEMGVILPAAAEAW